MAEEQSENALFQAAAQLKGKARSSFLDAACSGAPALRQRLEALLLAHAHSPNALAGAAPAEPSTLKLDFAPELTDAAVGSKIGRYKVLEKVGEGGCGVVYVAEQTEPVRRRVALKVIKLGMDTKCVVARFEAERQALAMMDHPNIAKVLDAGATETGRPYFVMELVRGIRITDYCDQNNLPTKERLDLFIQVCQAIQHAHQKGIIHRDVKPSNILVTLHDGVPVPKVIDFGIAKATEGKLTEATVYTQLHQFIGTPAYMSPEQAEVSGLDIDTRSDIYSLGVLLYELLTGKTPFDADELMSHGIDAMRKAIREQDPLRPSTRLATLRGEELTTTARRRAAEVPKLIHLLRGDLDWVVMKCLEKDRTRRYETANCLALDLKRHLGHEPVLARPPSTVYRLQKSWRRNRLIFSAGAAVVTAMLIAMGGILASARSESRARVQESIQRKLAETRLVEAQSARSLAESEKQRADAQAQEAKESQAHSRRLLYAADMNLAQQALKQNNLGRARLLLARHRPRDGEEDLRGWEWRYLWQQTRSTALATLTNRLTRGLDVSFSPDGTYLTVAWYDGLVELWDVPNRRLIRSLVDGGLYQFGHVAFSPVRNLLAATSGRGTVTFYDLDSGERSQAWQPPAEGNWRVNDLSFSQDGTRLVLCASGSSLSSADAVYVVNTASGQVESRHTYNLAFSQFHGPARLSPDNRRLYLAPADFRDRRYALRCIDVQSGEEIWTSEEHEDFGLTALAISPDGRWAASGSGFGDPTIRIWDAHTGRLMVRLEGHTGWIGQLVFARDGRQLVSASTDQTIRVWNTGTWNEAAVLRGHSDEIHAVDVSERANLMASTGREGNLVLWRADEKEGAAGYLILAESYQDSAPAALGGSRLYFPGLRRTAELRDLVNGVPASALPELRVTGTLRCYGTNSLCYWDGKDRVVSAELVGTNMIPHGAVELNPGSVPRVFAFTPEHQMIAWIELGSESTIQVASQHNPGQRRELKNDLAGVSHLRFSQDGKHLAAISQRGARVWVIETSQMLVQLNEAILDLVFAVDGRVFVADVGRDQVDHEIRFYDLSQPNRPARRFPGKDFSRKLSVSPDGRLVAACTDTGQFMIFDADKGELIETVRAHLNATFIVDFSPDGRRLITSNGGREAIKVWDAGTRQELITLSGLGSALRQASWSPDGNEIITGVPWQLWYAPSWAEINAAEEKEAAERSSK